MATRSDEYALENSQGILVVSLNVVNFMLFVLLNYVSIKFIQIRIPCPMIPWAQTESHAYLMRALFKIILVSSTRVMLLFPSNVLIISSNDFLLLLAICSYSTVVQQIFNKQLRLLLVISDGFLCGFYFFFLAEAFASPHKRSIGSHVVFSLSVAIAAKCVADRRATAFQHRTVTKDLTSAFEEERGFYTLLRMLFEGDRKQKATLVHAVKRHLEDSSVSAHNRCGLCEVAEELAEGYEGFEFSQRIQIE